MSVASDVGSAVGNDNNNLNDDLGTPDDKPTQMYFDFLNTVLKK